MILTADAAAGLLLLSVPNHVDTPKRRLHRAFFDLENE